MKLLITSIFIMICISSKSGQRDHVLEELQRDLELIDNTIKFISNQDIINDMESRRLKKIKEIRKHETTSNCIIFS